MCFPFHTPLQISEELLAIARERRQPLIRARSGASSGGWGEGAAASSGGGNGGGSSEGLRFLYDCEDLLDALSSLPEEEPVASVAGGSRATSDILDGSLWGLIKVTFFFFFSNLWSHGVDDFFFKNYV